MTTDAPAKSLSDSPRIFHNALLDRLSRIDHRVPVIVYGPIIAALLIWSALHLAPGGVLLAVVCGYIYWTLCEYFAHRFLFHWEMTSPFGARVHFLLHGIHHVYPSDPLRLVMPLLMSVPLILAGSALLIAIGGTYGIPATAGGIAGYVAYDMVHYHLHHGEPRTAYGRFLRRAHMLHHFRDPHRGYGVSAPWLDYVFGTAFKA